MAGVEFGDDRGMIAAPDQWPMWPRLPLKRPATAAYGVLVERDPLNPDEDAAQLTFWWFPGLLMGQHLPDFDPSRFLTLAQAQALVDDGWIVD